MKNILVILTQANLTSLQVHESLSATMVLATFGTQVSVVLQDAALSLLHSELSFDQFKHRFKIASNMVDSFEFYDITPIYIDQKYQSSNFTQRAEQDIEYIEFNAAFMQKFDHILYW